MSTVPSKRTATEAQEVAWVADEDRFVLQQSKAKAFIRVKGGRAQPIDWLAVILAIIDPDHNAIEELDSDELDIVNPSSILEKLNESEVLDLEKGIDTYLALEKSKSNYDYWQMMKTICQDRRKQFETSQQTVRGIGTVTADIDKILNPKTLPELEKLEKQIQTKLASGGPIDTDYWEHLLKTLLTYKAKAKLAGVSKSILNSRRKSSKNGSSLGQNEEQDESGTHPKDNDDKNTLQEYRVASKSGEIAMPTPASKRQRIDAELSTSTSAFDREVARGLGENEEVFTTEEEVLTKNKAQWSGQHRPRKPRHFNRVVTGYEWNKYNQTHYDHDNPPPKVVQGYKFNVFYPDLIDKTKAPTYKIEREGGRKRGQSFAPAGEDDTCLIRFIAGAPYEDIAFRIVDKEWDYSARRERGFKSSFDKGILQLHFQFKKVFYRK